MGFSFRQDSKLAPPLVDVVRRAPVLYLIYMLALLLLAAFWLPMLQPHIPQEPAPAVDPQARKIGETIQDFMERNIGQNITWSAYIRPDGFCEIAILPTIK